MPGEGLPFTTRVEPGSPPQSPEGQEWWRRRVLPPGPLRLFRQAFIAIVAVATSNI